jgi:regulatory protein
MAKREKVYLENKLVSVAIKNIPFLNTYEEAAKKAFQEGLMAALRYLKQRIRSVYEVERSLSEKGFISEEIQLVSNYLLEKKMLNDELFLRIFLEDYQKTRPYGVFALKQKLLAKGIKNSLIEIAIAEYYTENSLEVEAWNLIEKNSGRFRNMEKFERIKKVTAYLFNRGFDYEIIEGILSRLEKSEH